MFTRSWMSYTALTNEHLPKMKNFSGHHIKSKAFLGLFKTKINDIVECLELKTQADYICAKSLI